jgi:hypothetical protein
MPTITDGRRGRLDLDGRCRVAAPLPREAALLTVAALVAAASNTASVAGHARARAAASHLADPARRLRIDTTQSASGSRARAPLVTADLGPKNCGGLALLLRDL